MLLQTLAERFRFEINFLLPRTAFAGARNMVYNVKPCFQYFQAIKLLFSMYFQSNNRDTDLTLMREGYSTDAYRLNDYLFHIGSNNVKILTDIPEKALDYTTILKPYDIYIWMSIGVSVFAVMFTMVAISQTSSLWIENPARSSIHHCK